MLPRILGASIVLTLLGLSVYPVLLNPAVQASPQEVTVVTRTKGHEELKATILGGQLKISLKNNHTETITAFAISFGDTRRISLILRFVSVLNPVGFLRRVIPPPVYPLVLNSQRFTSLLWYLTMVQTMGTSKWHSK